MVGAYKCGFRLTKKPAYRDAAGDLIAGLNKGAIARWATYDRADRPILT
jgi:hypothetical protein